MQYEISNENYLKVIQQFEALRNEQKQAFVPLALAAASTGLLGLWPITVIALIAGYISFKGFALAKDHIQRATNTPVEYFREQHGCHIAAF